MCSAGTDARSSGNGATARGRGGGGAAEGRRRPGRGCGGRSRAAEAGWSVAAAGDFGRASPRAGSIVGAYIQKGL